MPELASLALTRMYELYHIGRRREKNPSPFFFTAEHVQYIYTHTRPQSLLRDIALQASVHDFLNSTSAAATAAATMSSVFAETSICDENGKNDDNESNAEDDDTDRGRRRRDDEFLKNDDDDDDDFYYPHQPSYAYMTLSVSFSNDLLHAVREYVLSSVRKTAENNPKHPFQTRQDQDINPKFSFPSPSSSFLFPTTTATKPTACPSTTPPPPLVGTSFAPSPIPASDSLFVTPKRDHEQGLGLNLDAYKRERGVILSSSLLTKTPLPPSQKIGNSRTIESRSYEVQDSTPQREDRCGKEPTKLSVPVTGLLTPDATPTKKKSGGGKSVSERVRRKNLGNWVIDDANAPIAPVSTMAVATGIDITHTTSTDVDVDVDANPAPTGVIKTATTGKNIGLSSENERKKPEPAIAVTVAIAGPSEAESESESSTAADQKYLLDFFFPKSPAPALKAKSKSDVPEFLNSDQNIDLDLTDLLSGLSSMPTSMLAPAPASVTGLGAGLGQGQGFAKKEEMRGDIDEGIGGEMVSEKVGGEMKAQDEIRVTAEQEEEEEVEEEEEIL